MQGTVEREWHQIPLFHFDRLEDRHDIRLLHVLPGKPGDVLQCKCIRCPLGRGPSESPGPEYTAISYTWGNVNQTEPILLNDRKYYTTQNARDVLLHMRSQQTTQVVWIDAICIDQNTIAERNDQVRRMDQIFANAQQTLVWLGHASEDSDVAMDFIPTINQALSDLEGSESLTDTMLLQKLATQLDSPSWVALGNLFARPWFQRVWVIQEVALSRITHIVCGERKLAWEDVGCMIENMLRWRLIHLIKQKASSNQLTTGASTLFCIQNTRRQMQAGNKRALSAVLFETMGFLATDAKDQVFGILGLVRNTKDGGLQVNYEDTVQDVYIKATRWSLQDEMSLDILYLAGVTHTRNISNLPSWVPDFSLDISINPFGLPIPGQPVPYQAGGNTISSRRFLDNCLIVQGVVVGTLHDFGHARVAAFQLRDEKAHKTWRDWVLQAIELTATHKDRALHQKTSGGLWRTLIANVAHPSKQLAPLCYAKYLESFREVYIDDVRHQDLDWREAHARVANDKALCDDVKDEAQQYLFAFLDASIGRRFCVTDSGELGLVPAGVAKRDRVCVFLGAKTPFIIREVPDGDSGQGKFVLVGDCYIDGLMQGEGLMMGKVEEITIQ
jgi:hypothetical protein